MSHQPHGAIPLLVTPAWLAARLHWDHVVVLDATVLLDFPPDGPYTARSGYEGFLAEHLPGAVFADLLTELSEPSAPALFTVPTANRFAVAAGALGVGRGRLVVVYDRGGNAWATRMWWLLRLFGFDDVAVLDGGLSAWRLANHPVEPGPVRARPATFSPHLRPDLLADAEEVQHLSDGHGCLVLTLDEVTFRGEGPSRYARPGRIPGSKHLPSSSLLDPGTGRFLPAEELRHVLASGGVLDAPRAVSYCGAGISATVVAFAAAVAGRPDVAVYDGSLTEWAADPARPLVTG